MRTASSFLVLGLFVCGSRAFFDYIPPIALIKTGVMKLSGNSDEKINEVLKKGSYYHHTLNKAAESGVNLIAGDAKSAKQHINDIGEYVDELKSMPD